MSSLQLACAEFRNIVLAIPEAWTLIDSRMKIQNILAHIARSEDYPMSLRINWAPTQVNREYSTALFTVLKANSYRLSHAAVHISLSKDAVEALGDDFLPLLIDWELPSLTTLTYDARIDLYQNYVLDTEWRMPELRSLACRGDEASILLSVGAPVRNLVISPGENQLFAEDSLRELLEMVAPSVESILFDFSKSEGLRHFTEGVTLERFRKVLPLLKGVYIKLHHEKCNFELIKLLNCVDLSNIDRVEVSVHPQVKKSVSREDTKVFEEFMTQKPTRLERHGYYHVQDAPGIIRGVSAMNNRDQTRFEVFVRETSVE
jgi:hypothetical protein